MLLVNLAASIARECGLLASDSEKVISRIEGGTRLESKHREAALEHFSNAIKGSISPIDCAEEFRNAFKTQPHTLTACIDTMLRVFVEDKKIKPAADRNIRKTAEIFKFPPFELEKLRARHLGIKPRSTGKVGSDAASSKSSKDLSIHYAQLGCQPGAKLEEIKRAYRQLALIYHPDKTKGLDISPEVEDDLYRRFQEIKGAYESLLEEIRK